MLLDVLDQDFDQWMSAAAQLPVQAAGFHQALDELKQRLDQSFEAGLAVQYLVERLTRATDHLLIRAWTHHMQSYSEACALLAVGGYGRGELHPGSDIDILILHPPSLEAAQEEAIGAFLTFLWDMRLDLGSSVRTVDACIEEGSQDLSIATTFFESRLLAGSQPLLETFEQAIQAPDFWPSQTFFKAKREEQAARHARFGDTAYRLEPNLKESPGGLRDIQILSWILTRHFGVKTLRELVDVGFLTLAEYDLLDSSRNFLWRTRYGLHRLVGRKEDRLLFEHQKAVAAWFGFTDTRGNLAVEQFMKQYFRVVTDIQRLNEMLLQLFEEQITLKNVLASPQPINERFQSRSGYLEITHPDVFEQYPPALLEMFLLLQRDPGLVGVRATTIRAVRSSLHLINDDFRQDPRCTSLFMEILRQPSGIYHEFRHMNSYGVLARYLPEFGHLVGLMQFDLFHAYTVDEHIIMVLRYARRLLDEKYFDEEPACSELATKLRDPVLLYIACLYHDIAKGRGGDHSELGVADARRFCQRHGLSEDDTDLICWLVRHHLTMSTVAQRKDISDPDVITEFVHEVKTLERLDYLYLLTVSDIRGTNPDLWNDWKSKLLSSLYHSSKKMLLSSDRELPPAESLLDTSQAALQMLVSEGYPEARIVALWEQFDCGYFLHHEAEAIAWHTREILELEDPDEILVTVRPRGERGATEVLVHVSDRSTLFYKVSREIARLGLNILGADIHTTSAGMALQVFYVLNKDGHPCVEQSDLALIRSRIAAALESGETAGHSRSPARDRKLKSFDSPTEIEFTTFANKRYTELHISTGDRPGLLADIGYVLAQNGVDIQRAFIATVSERAEDVLHVTSDGEPLTAAAQDHLRAALSRML